MAFDPFTAGFDLIKTGLDKFFPDANEELKGKLSQAAAEISNEYNLQLAQLNINSVEAQHPSIFVAGWRPFIGWVGGSGLAYQFIFMPVLNGVIGFFGMPPVFMSIDIGLLQTTLGTMLGLGVARSYDKKAGTDTKAMVRK